MKTTTSLFFILAAAGLLHSASAVDQPPGAAVTTNPARAGNGVEVGIARRDGVTIDGGEAFVTRNGVTEKLAKDLLLPSGVKVQPDGTVVMPDKTETTLRATQILTFEGKIVPLPLDPNTNPGDPRGNGTAAVNTNGASPTATAGGATMGGAAGTSRSTLRDRPAANGSVFLGSDGLPFMGTINPDGTILRADGTLVPFDGTFRAVTFGPDGTPALGTVNRNGTIVRADGSIVSPDGSVRSANGTLISPATQNNSGTANNGNSNPGVPQQNNNRTPLTNNGVAAGSNTNSPNNTGTVNNGNTNAGGTSGTQQGTNRQGTTSQQGTNQQRTRQQGTNASGDRTNGGTRGTNGATGGAASGGGATGAGGASGGAAGGASR